jgi:hypothetical protein
MRFDANVCAIDDQRRQARREGSPGRQPWVNVKKPAEPRRGDTSLDLVLPDTTAPNEKAPPRRRHRAPMATHSRKRVLLFGLHHGEQNTIEGDENTRNATDLYFEVREPHLKLSPERVLANGGKEHG